MSSVQYDTDEPHGVSEGASRGGDGLLAALGRLPPLIPDASRSRRLRERCRAELARTNIATSAGDGTRRYQGVVLLLILVATLLTVVWLG